LNTNVNGVNGRGSPYGSPNPGEDRGRSPHRYSRGGTSSPRHAIGSPLARVAEEGGSGKHEVKSGGDHVRDFAAPMDGVVPVGKKEKLVDAPTPVMSRQVTREFVSTGLSRVSTDSEASAARESGGVQKSPPGDVRGLGVDVNGEGEGEMKNVTI
jgi:hypothetical protein